jgi:pimeloyl-ACP methyl ester carboxylesterase
VTRPAPVIPDLAAAPAWEPVRVPTAAGPGGELLLGVVDGRQHGDDPTFVVAQGFLAFVEPYEMQRFQVIASVLRARLVVVETPGAGFAASRLLPAERRALLRGDFTVPARRMLRAATEFLTARDGDGVAGTGGPFHVLGYSLGASFAAAMAAVSATTRTYPPVESVVLVEPVALRRWSAAGLLTAVRHENRLVQAYVDHTATVPGAVRPLDARPGAAPPTRRRCDLLLLANALRAARLTDDLVTAARRQDGRPERRPRRLIVVRGDESALSPRQETQDLLAAAERHGITARLLRVPGPHAFWHSLPAVTAAATELNRTLEGLPE